MKGLDEEAKSRVVQFLDDLILLDSDVFLKGGVVSKIEVVN